MTRLPAIAPETATGKQKTLLDSVQKKLGRVPNLMRVLGNAPAALDGYLAFAGALAAGSLDAKVREQLALTVAAANLCDYCLAAHTAIGGMVGLSTDDVQQARQATAANPKTRAILALARSITVNRGVIPDADLAAARAAGISNAEIVETTANVALNILTNYVNHVADTVIDFPVVAPATGSGCETGSCTTS
ncbi:MAG: carboxymuconolactone decarboxylase family protein [Planctomycetes bacterium]|nr:carboxymuconolactone decarboxylase family protein [Planctomycetota bacterium]